MATETTSKYTHRRVIVLVLVHLAMVAHYVHWKLAGRTLAPLELNEAVYTAAEGVVTAGFVLLVVAALCTAVFGRFFCAWGCHILALQDLAVWLLRKVGVTPRPVRSRVLRALPFVVMLYMFVWPVVYRALHGIEVQTHTRSAGMAWSSFLTDDFTRNLPGPFVAITTLAVCGVAAVYVLGSRSFCATVCPYGGVFSVADRLAPGRIVARGDCSDCGACTAVCQSHVRVHQELANFGTIVDTACMRDLDCVAACPDGRVRFGFTKPPLFRSLRGTAMPERKWDYTVAEELLLVALVAAAVFALRGLFGAFPLLLTLVVGVLLGFVTLLSLKVLRAENVRFQKLALRQAKHVTALGGTWLGVNFALLAFVGYSGAMRVERWRGEAALARAEATSAVPLEAAPHAREAFTHLARLERFALDAPSDLAHDLARAAVLSGDRDEALRRLRADPERLEFRLEAVRLVAEGGDVAGALAEVRRIVEHWPDSAAAHYQLGVLLAASGEVPQAVASFERSIELAPDDADARNNLGFLLLESGLVAEAETHLRRAVALAPSYAAAHFNLGRLLLATSRTAEARIQLETARACDPSFAAAVRAALEPRR